MDVSRQSRAAGVESEMSMREPHQLAISYEELRVRLETRSEVEDLGS